MKFPESRGFHDRPRSKARLEAAARIRASQERALATKKALLEKQAQNENSKSSLLQSVKSKGSSMSNLSYSTGEAYLDSIAQPSGGHITGTESSKTTIFSYSASTGGWKPRRRHELLIGGVSSSLTKSHKWQAHDSVRTIQREIDAAFTSAVEKLPHSLGPKELLQSASTTDHVHEAFRESAKLAAAQTGCNSLDAGGLIGRLWREHCEPLFALAKGYEEELLEAERTGSLQGNGTLMKRIQALLNESSAPYLKSKASFRSIKSAPSSNSLEEMNRSHSPPKTKVENQIVEASGNVAKEADRDASATTIEIMNSVEEILYQLAMLKRLRSVMFDEHTRWHRERDAEWQLKKNTLLASSYNLPEFSGSERAGYHFIKRVHSSSGHLEMQWRWHKFEDSDERSRVLAGVIRIQAQIRKYLAVQKILSYRYKQLGGLSRPQFAMSLQDVVSSYQRSKAKIMQKGRVGEVANEKKSNDHDMNIAKNAVAEILWETKRLARDLSSQWWRQIRERKQLESSLNDRILIQRKKTMETSSILDTLAHRAHQLVSHMRRKRKGDITKTQARLHRLLDGLEDLSDEESKNSPMQTPGKKTKKRKKVPKFVFPKSEAEIAAEIQKADDREVALAVELGKVVDQHLEEEIRHATSAEARATKVVSTGTQTNISRIKKKHIRDAHYSMDGSTGGPRDSHQNQLDDNSKMSLKGDLFSKAKAPGMGKVISLVATSNAENGLKNDDNEETVDQKKNSQKRSAASMFMLALSGGDGQDTEKKQSSASFMGLLRALGKFRGLRKHQQRTPAKRLVMSNILEIYLSKIPIDVQSDTDGVPRVNFARYCYQFFYRRFGLRKLAEKHLIGLNASFHKYGSNMQSSPRIHLFARFCGVFGKLHHDVLDFLLLLIATCRDRDKDALEMFEDGSSWVSESRAVMLIRFAADVMCHSGPQILNKLITYEEDGGDSEHLLDKEDGAISRESDIASDIAEGVSFAKIYESMLGEVSSKAITAHRIVETVACCLGGGGGSAKKVIARLRVRPDFAQGLSHLVPLLRKHDEKSLNKLLNLGQPEFKGNNKEAEGDKMLPSPIRLYRDWEARRAVLKASENADKGVVKGPGKSPKNASSPSINQKGNTNSGVNEKKSSAEINGAWFNEANEESYVRGREAWGVSLDTVLRICVEQYIKLRRQLILKLESLYNELWQPLRKLPTEGRKKSSGGSFFDFQTLLFSVDPTLSDSVVHKIYDQCVEKTAQDAGVTLGASAEDYDSEEDDDEYDEDNTLEEHDDISPEAFVAVCISNGLLRSYCRTFGKRPRTTGGQKAYLIEGYKKLIRQVSLLKGLNPRQIHELAHAFRKRSFDPRIAIVRQGEEGDAFYVIKKGKVDVWMKKERGSQKQWVAELGEGQFFGEKALLTKEVRNADCIAKTHVECLMVDKESFEQSLGPLETILRKTAEEFTTLYKDWSEIHEPKVNNYIQNKQKHLEARQNEYRIAEIQHKAKLGDAIDRLNGEIQEVKDMKKAIAGKLKARESALATREHIRELLLFVDVGNTAGSKVISQEDGDHGHIEVNDQSSAI